MVTAGADENADHDPCASGRPAEFIPCKHLPQEEPRDSSSPIPTTPARPETLDVSATLPRSRRAVKIVLAYAGDDSPSAERLPRLCRQQPTQRKLYFSEEFGGTNGPIQFYITVDGQSRRCLIPMSSR